MSKNFPVHSASTLPECPSPLEPGKAQKYRASRFLVPRMPASMRACGASGLLVIARRGEHSRKEEVEHVGVH